MVLGYLFAPSAHAETYINNSINVSANGSDGGGTNSVAVTTVVNGEVVEDWSSTSTEPITYSKTYISTSSGVDEEETTRDQLKAMVAQLEAIISYYVSLLKN